MTGAAMQRAVALLLLAAVVAAVAVGGVVPALAAFDARTERIESLQDSVARYARVAARGDAVRAELARLEGAALLREGSYGEATAGLAAATLQERLRELVTAAGGEIVSVRVMPERVVDTFGIIGVEARVRLDVAGLRQVLYRLESGERVLRVGRLLVRSTQRGGRRAATGAARAAAERLDVQFEVLGFRQRAADGGES